MYDTDALLPVRHFNNFDVGMLVFQEAATSCPKGGLPISKIPAVRMSRDSRTTGVCQLKFVFDD